ncbi:MAG: arginase [Rhodocyclales bacterium]|nr:arginase [Rhodocyclales bacterium]
MASRRIRVVGVASGYGAGIPECQDGSEVLRALHFLDDLAGADGGLAWDEALRLAPPVPDDAVEAVRRIALALAERVAAHRAAGDFPLVIGGDHSCAIGTWSGMRRSLEAGRRLGLVWVDAHMDSHTLESSPSHNVHGMPLACLLGHGDPRLTGIDPAGAKLLPADVCLIGVRSFEAAEAALLRELGVRVYFMDEVRRRGLPEVFGEALQRVARDTAGYGISIDLDALDPAEGPGVGTPVGGGLARAELAAALALADGDERLLALEIVEYNPYRDEGFVTARAIHDLCRSLIEI